MQSLQAVLFVIEWMAPLAAMTMETKNEVSRLARVRVRTARKGDAASLSTFFMRAWKEGGPDSLGFTGATEEDIEEIASEEFLAQMLSNPKVRIVVVERKKSILGFASIKGMDRGKAELSGIVVLLSESGMGLGTKLVRTACDVAVKLGFRRLMVKTETFNEKAIGLYKKNGFSETRKTTEKVGRTKVPTQLLEKRLS